MRDVTQIWTFLGGKMNNPGFILFEESMICQIAAGMVLSF